MSTPERRKNARLLLSSTGSNPVVATVGVVPRAAILHNMSANGIGLITTDPPPVGSVVPVWLALPSGSRSRMILFRVIHISRHARDLSRLGMACADEAGATTLGDMLAAMEG